LSMFEKEFQAARQAITAPAPAPLEEAERICRKNPGPTIPRHADACTCAAVVAAQPGGLTRRRNDRPRRHRRQSSRTLYYKNLANARRRRSPRQGHRHRLRPTMPATFSRAMRRLQFPVGEPAGGHGLNPKMRVASFRKRAAQSGSREGMKQTRNGAGPRRRQVAEAIVTFRRRAPASGQRSQDMEQILPALSFDGQRTRSGDRAYATPFARRA